MSKIPPSLTDAKGMGGLNALDGFDYQFWEGLIRIPAWLANPAFEAMIYEGFEDFEARFFSPTASTGHVLERYQAKSGDLGKKGLTEVFLSFKNFDESYPGVTRVHTLITPKLQNTQAWIARDSSRVRKARPFYAPFGSVVAAVDENLEKNLQQEFEKDLGTFVFRNVDIVLREIPDRNSAISLFSIEISAYSPDPDISQRKIASAFAALESHVRSHTGSAIERSTLNAILVEHLGFDIPGYRAFPIHVRSDRNGSNEKSLELDASNFSGTTAPYPGISEWQEGVLQPLDTTSQWLRKNSIGRVSLSGSYRLTTAFLLGWSFRSATGFDIEIETRGSIWATDEYPLAGASYPAWDISPTNELVDGRLIVGIGVLRDPTPEIVATLGSKIIPMTAVLPRAIDSGHMLQSIVQQMKAHISTACSQLRPKQIDLYYVGPAVAAVALGHRWNALPKTQLHEFDQVTRLYRKTALAP